MGIYKKLRTSHGQEIAAAKAGISVRSARWRSEIVPMLEAWPALTTTTLLEEVQRRHPGSYDDALLGTLQHRVRTWGASHGAEREAFFAQTHPPGCLGLSDFTHAAVLQVTVAGVALCTCCISLRWHTRAGAPTTLNECGQP